MSEWWSYRPSDFLLFSARTYHRLFELYNAELWPAHLLALAIGLVLVYTALQGGAQAARVACLLLAACWLWVAWAFHLQRYAAINWAATWFAAAFVVEGGLLFLCGVFGARLHIRSQRDWRGHLGLGLLVFALFIQPWLALLLFGRPWREAGLFGLAPDPTALATLGLLLLLRPLAPFAWMLWPIPLLWCLVGATTQWTLAAATARSDSVAVVPELDAPVRAVAEGLVLRSAAATEGVALARGAFAPVVGVEIEALDLIGSVSRDANARSTHPIGSGLGGAAVGDDAIRRAGRAPVIRKTDPDMGAVAERLPV